MKLEHSVYVPKLWGSVVLEQGPSSRAFSLPCSALLVVSFLVLVVHISLTVNKSSMYICPFIQYFSILVYLEHNFNPPSMSLYLFCTKRATTATAQPLLVEILKTSPSLHTFHSGLSVNVHVFMSCHSTRQSQLILGEEHVITVL